MVVRPGLAGSKDGASQRKGRKGALRKAQEEETGRVRSMLDFWIARASADCNLTTFYKSDKQRNESPTRTKTNVTFVPQTGRAHSLQTF